MTPPVGPCGSPAACQILVERSSHGSMVAATARATEARTAKRKECT